MRTSLLTGIVLTAAVVTAGCRSPGAAHDPTGARAALVDAARARITYAGELHDDVAQHAFQLEILQTMAAAAERSGEPLMLGMEMFQRPFQKHLDDYVAGRIDEREMLRRTEYFSRWNFDYTMYAPLWRFCREHGMRVVALNVERSVTGAITKGGLESLDAAQRRQIAREIDLDVPAHHARIIDRFAQVHPMPEPAMQRMYESMTTWDETMAESAADALAAAGPGSRMLVVVGAGHVEEWTGIPDRVSRRIPDIRSCLVVMNPLPPDSSEGAAQQRPGEHRILVPREEDVRPLMGVSLSTTPLPEGMLIESVAPDSNAARAGLLAGDVVHRIGAAPITDMTDWRYVLDATPLGSTAVVRVLRDGHWTDVAVTFAPPPPAPQG